MIQLKHCANHNVNFNPQTVSECPLCTAHIRISKHEIDVLSDKELRVASIQGAREERYPKRFRRTRLEMEQARLNGLP